MTPLDLIIFVLSKQPPWLDTECPFVLGVSYRAQYGPDPPAPEPGFNGHREWLWGQGIAKLTSIPPSQQRYVEAPSGGYSLRVGLLSCLPLPFGRECLVDCHAPRRAYESHGLRHSHGKLDRSSRGWHPEPTLIDALPICPLPTLASTVS